MLDLSRNGGGLLDYAVKITGFFIGKGGVVAVGDSRQQTQVLDDPDDGIAWSGPLVVLTSRVTASAAVGSSGSKPIRASSTRRPSKSACGVL